MYALELSSHNVEKRVNRIISNMFLYGGSGRKREYSILINPQKLHSLAVPSKFYSECNTYLQETVFVLVSFKCPLD